jgi:DNA-binding response OmpR family regulator
MGKLLLVDDDVSYTEKLKDAMAPLGWSVELVHNGRDAMQLLENFQYEFVLLDWHLPDMTGIDICTKFRAGGGTAHVIFLTGRGGIDDKEAGFGAGGDDYLVKPFDARELLARMRAIQRRQTPSGRGKFLLGEIQFDPQLRTVSKGEEKIALSPTESSLLEHLCKNPDKYFSSAALFEAVWPSEVASSDEAVRTHMLVLRRKLKLVTSQELIKTVRRAGYYIESKDIQA